MGQLPLVRLQKEFLLRHVYTALFRQHPHDFLKLFLVRGAKINRHAEAGYQRKFLLDRIVCMKFLIAVSLVAECLPDQMTAEETSAMVNDYIRRLESQGIPFKQYAEITGMTAEKLGEQMKPQALKRIRTRLTLEAVVKAENITASDEAVEAQFDKMAEAYKMDKEQIKGMFAGEQLDQLKEDVAVQEAIDFLVAEAKLVD